MLLGFVIGLIQTIVIMFVWMKYDVIQKENKKRYVLFTITAILTIGLHGLLFQQHYRPQTVINISVVYTIMAVLAGIDWEKKVIPNQILLIGFLIRAGLLAYEGLRYRETVKAELLNAAIGFSFGLLFLLLLSFITGHGIGYGDVKMFAWLGFCLGFFDTYYILFYSVLAAAVSGIYLLLAKKADKKKEMPFAPYVYIGCCLVFCMTFLQR